MADESVEDSRINPALAGGSWNESLFGCFSDMKLCCCGYWCLPCLFGTNAEKIDGSNCFLMSALYCLLGSCYLCWAPHWKKRELLREKYRLREDPCNDCLVALCCGPCGICQEARELKSRAGPLRAGAVRPVRNQPSVAYRK